MNDGSAMQTRMAELTRRFAARTRDEVGQMREALARLEAGEDGKAGLMRIQQMAHRICGTGGTLGLTVLSDTAASLERLIDMRPRHMIPGVTERAQIATAIDSIAAQIELL